MYKEVFKLNDVLEMPALMDDLMFFTSRKNRNILAYQNMKQIWATNEKEYSCNIIGEEIITASLKIYDFKGNVSYKHNNYGNYHFVLLDKANKLSLWKTIDEEKEVVLYHVFNIEEKKFVRENLVSKIPSCFVLTTCFICRSQDAEISLFDFIREMEIWSNNFSNLAEYIELDGEEVEGKIRQLWNYNGHIMVLTQMFLFKLNCETGEVIQQQKLSSGFMELCVYENKAYGCYGYHFIEIDLDTLDILCFKRMEYENYEGQELFTLMNKAVYHEGLVFHAVRLEGGLHCVGAIQPKTGERIWLHPIGVNDINSIAFHNNKMFVHDIGSTLHIFERDVVYK